MTIADGYYIVIPGKSLDKTIAELIGDTWYPVGCDYDPWTDEDVKVIARIDIDTYQIIKVVDH